MPELWAIQDAVHRLADLIGADLVDFEGERPRKVHINPSHLDVLLDGMVEVKPAEPDDGFQRFTGRLCGMSLILIVDQPEPSQTVEELLTDEGLLQHGVVVLNISTEAGKHSRVVLA